MRRAACLLLISVWAGGPAPAEAADARIYSCVDAQGRRLSSDRPIPECLSQEQRLIGRDGTPRGVVAPIGSREEQERLEIQRKQQSQAKAVLNETARRDRILLTRYPDAAAHEVARQRELAPVRKRIEAAEQRLQVLEAEAKTLATEQKNLAGKPMSEDLRSRISVNEGATEAQRNIALSQAAEQDRLNQQFNDERVRLRLLWRGMAPGTSAASAAAAPPPPSPAAPPPGSTP